MKERVARERILSHQLSGRRIRMILAFLGMVLGEAVEHGWIKHNPVRDTRKRVSATPQRRSAFLTRDELLVLEEVTRQFESHERLPVSIAAWGGLCKGEVFGLQRRDFERANSLVRIERILTRGEAGKAKRWNSGRRWKKITRALFAAMTNQVRVAALRDGTAETRPLAFHSVRHSCATAMAEGGQY